MDPTIQKAFDQGFFGVSQGFQQAAMRYNTEAGQIANDASRMFQMSQQLVGAAAAGRLDRNTLASDILQQRSAMDQPQIAPSQMVPVKV